ELANFDGQAKVAALDTAHLMGNLRERLADWQGLLRRQTPEARQLLRTLLVGRLIFTPHQDPTGRYYQLVGQGSISPLITGVVLPKGSWPQRDSNPCFMSATRFRNGRKRLGAVDSTSALWGLKFAPDLRPLGA